MRAPPPPVTEMRTPSHIATFATFQTIRCSERNEAMLPHSLRKPCANTRFGT